MSADELRRLTIVSGLRSSVSSSVSSLHLSLGGRRMLGGERLVRAQTVGAGDGQRPRDSTAPLSSLPPPARLEDTGLPLCRDPTPAGATWTLLSPPLRPEMTVCTLRAARLHAHLPGQSQGHGEARLETWVPTFL